MAPSPKALKTLFFLLGCFVTVSVVSTVIIDGLPFRKELLTPWMAATLIDFYINVFAIALWVIYKETSWITTLLWIVLLICFGSITTCFYIFLKFLKLSSSQESSDPIYYVLNKPEIKEGMEDKTIFSVAVARALFGVLGCLMLGTLIYTIITDGSPFRIELLTPWMLATLFDFYTNVVALSVWVLYKESSRCVAFVWILLFVCFGSISTCAYIVLQLLHLSARDPVYLILFRSNNRTGSGYERTSQRASAVVG